MPFPDVTFQPGTSHDALLDKLQRFIQSAMPWWKRTVSALTVEGLDHGLLIGLGDDDHLQYLTQTRHNALTGSHVTNGNTHDHSGGDGGQIDHGGLAGLADDDHTQYLNETRHTALPGAHVFSGAIIGMAGYVSDCPSGWAVCDGTNGTPDLTASFIS